MKTVEYPEPAAYTQAIIKGCCTSDRFEYYGQGGTGYLLSRRAVEIYNENWQQYFTTFRNFEDRAINELISKARVSFKDLSSTFFIGDRIKKQFLNYMKEGNFQSLPICPKNHPYTQCANEFYMLNKVASVHKVDDYSPSIKEMIDKQLIPDNVRFYHNSWNPSLCYMSNEKLCFFFSLKSIHFFDSKLFFSYIWNRAIN